MIGPDPARLERIFASADYRRNDYRRIVSQLEPVSSIGSTKAMSVPGPQSIRSRLFSLPDSTVVHTGHGGDTTIGDEAAAL